MAATVVGATSSLTAGGFLPTGMQAGDVIVLICSGYPAAQPFGSLAGYTKLLEQNAGSGSGNCVIYWKVAAASDNGASIVIPQGLNQFAAVAVRGADPVNPFGTYAMKQNAWVQQVTWASVTTSSPSLVLWIDSLIGGDAGTPVHTFPTVLVNQHDGGTATFVAATTQGSAGLLNPPSSLTHTNYLNSATVSLPIGGAVVTTPPTLNLLPFNFEVKYPGTVRVSAVTSPDVANNVSLTKYEWTVTSVTPAPTLEGASGSVLRFEPKAAGAYTVTCKVTDSVGKSATKSVVVNVNSDLKVWTDAGAKDASRRVWKETPRFFGGIWVAPLADDHPLEDRPTYNGTSDPSGVPYHTRLANQAHYSVNSTPVKGYYAPGYGTNIGEATSLFVIPRADHPRRRVSLVQGGNVVGDPYIGGLAGKFASVPVPTGLDGSRFETYYNRQMWGSGPDQHLCIWDPFTNEMWEMFQFEWNASANRYQFSYGAYIANATGPNAPENIGNGTWVWGARATSLPLIGGVMMHHEYEQGAFRHPIQLTIPVPKKNAFIPPATREDENIVPNTQGGDRRDEVAEGSMYRLPAGYPIDSTKHKLWQMIVRAVRDYGLIITDASGGSMGFNREGDAVRGTPYALTSGPGFPEDGELYGGNPGGNVAWNFPWDDLVQIKYVQNI